MKNVRPHLASARTLGPAPHKLLQSGADIGQSAARAGYEHHCVAKRSRPIRGSLADEPLVFGDFSLGRQYGGLAVHVFNGTELEDVSVQAQIPPGVSLSLILRGNLSFSLDGGYHHWGDRHANPAQEDCLAYNLLAPALWQRSLQRGRTLTKINLSVSPHWLAQRLDRDCLSAPFFVDHRAFCFWRASPRLLSIAREMLNLVQHGPGRQQELTFEGLTLAFAGEYLAAIVGAHRGVEGGTSGAPRPRLAPPVSLEAVKIQSYIESHLERCEPGAFPSLEAIAKAVAMSVSKVQRVFKEEQGQTVMDYVRSRRLAMAHDGLRQQRLSIGEAAYLAGYRHPSNFAAAFKRTFGVAPGEVKALAPGA